MSSPAWRRRRTRTRLRIAVRRSLRAGAWLEHHGWKLQPWQQELLTRWHVQLIRDGRRL